ncbi:MAG: helicase-related protein, partial [Planctomycetota bacterium]
SEDDSAEDADVIAAKKTVDEETADDRENEKRQSTASVVIGSWLKDIADDLKVEIEGLDKAVAGLGIKLDDENTTQQNPKSDGRFTELLQLIKDKLLKSGEWTADERIVIFTEYKTTLDYLLRRLREECPDSEGRILCLYGGMHDTEREQIKEAFNDPEAQVRILIGTDAASEGLNLQETARYLLHYDCPWNPSRIEQRNGRLDRHGQARDVQTYHFVSNASADMRFISHLITKVDQIREDLGGVGDILDEAMHRRLIMGESLDEVQQDLDLKIEAAKDSTQMDADDSFSIGEDGDRYNLKVLDALADEIDLDSDSQQSVLDSAMAIYAGRPQIDGPNEDRLCKIINPSLSGWSDAIDETVRRTATGSAKGQLPFLAFDAQPFLREISGRIVFRPRHEVQMMHLGHPIMGKAVSSLGRRRFPGPNAVSRWAARYADVPEGCDAMILLHVEELGVNELRETFHHWIRTYCYSVKDGEIDKPLEHRPAIQLRPYDRCKDQPGKATAEDLLADVEVALKKEVKRIREQLTDDLTKLLESDGKTAVEQENKSFASRQGEVSALIADLSVKKLENEIVELKRQKAQGTLFDQQANLDELDRDIKLKEEEVKRRRSHYEQVRDQLAKERDRIINRMLPKRFALYGTAQVFPLAVEVRLPKGGTK